MVQKGSAPGGTFCLGGHALPFYLPHRPASWTPLRLRNPAFRALNSFWSGGVEKEQLDSPRSSRGGSLTRARAGPPSSLPPLCSTVPAQPDLCSCQTAGLGEASGAECDRLGFEPCARSRAGGLSGEGGPLGRQHRPGSGGWSTVGKVLARAQVATAAAARRARLPPSGAPLQHGASSSAALHAAPCRSLCSPEPGGL